MVNTALGDGSVSKELYCSIYWQMYMDSEAEEEVDRDHRGGLVV